MFLILISHNQGQLENETGVAGAATRVASAIPNGLHSITTDFLEWLDKLYASQFLYYFKHTVVIPKCMKNLFRRCFEYVVVLKSSHRKLGFVLELSLFTMICAPIGTNSDASMTDVLTSRMGRFL